MIWVPSGYKANVPIQPGNHWLKLIKWLIFYILFEAPDNGCGGFKPGMLPRKIREYLAYTLINLVRFLDNPFPARQLPLEIKLIVF
jgi:hypothetical protein